MSISALKTDLLKTLSGIIRQCGQTTLFKKGMAVEIIFFKITISDKLTLALNQQ